VFALPLRKPKQEEKEEEENKKNEVSLRYIDSILRNQVFRENVSFFCQNNPELEDYYQQQYTECPGILIEHARRFPSYLRGQYRAQAFVGTLYELMVLRLRELMIQSPRSTILLDVLPIRHWHSLFDWAVNGIDGTYFEYVTLCVIRIVYCSPWSSGIYQTKCTISDVFDFAVRITKKYGTTSPCYASDLMALWKKILGKAEWKRNFLELFYTNEVEEEEEQDKEDKVQKECFPASFMALLDCPLRKDVASLHQSHPVIEQFHHLRCYRLCIEFMYTTLFTGSYNIRDQAILFWPFLISRDGYFMSVEECCTYIQEETHLTKSARWTLNQINTK
jgi:hypothetical protein